MGSLAARQRARRRHRRVRRVALACLILLASGGLLMIASEHHRSFDWTGNTRHSLGSASVAALAALKSPITVSVYLPSRHVGRESARNLVARYQRVVPGITLHFIEPAAAPEVMRNANLREGEMVITVEQREERLRTYTEAAFTNALAKLARKDRQWLAFITGHGERSPVREANFDLSDFAKALGQRGIAARELSLAGEGAIPDNTAAVVLASPQVDFMPGEVALLQRYLDRGGSLVWLLEPGVPASLGPVAASLGLAPDARTVIDPTTQAMGIEDPAMAIVTQFEAHPALGSFSSTVLLAHAAVVNLKAPAGWTSQPLFSSGPRAWAETSPVVNSVSFDEGVDTRGPLPLAQTMVRKSQRVVMVGDGDFLSNTYLGNGGNRELGIRLVEWACANDSLVEVTSVPAPDRELALKPWQVAIMGGGFLIGLPLAFLLNGLSLWWRRRA